MSHESGLDPRIVEQIGGLITPEIAMQRFKAAGTLIIADTLDRVLLGWHSETDETGQNFFNGWGNSAGRKESGEIAWQTALRETWEEFGISCPQSPSSEPLIMIVYEGEISLETLDIGICYPVVVDSSFIRPEQMKSPSEVKYFQWFNFLDLNCLTEVFTDHQSLWGGCWTEMVLRRWVEESHGDLGLFPGIIAFRRFLPERSRSSYERAKLKK